MAKFDRQTPPRNRPLLSFKPVYARKLFDIPWILILHGVFLALIPRWLRTKKPSAEELEQLWSPSQTLVTLSVRSALDLILQSCDFPSGSEVIISAVTIPDMVRIIKLHGLVPVPVDIQETDASVSAADVASLISPKTKAILLAQLFGARHSITAVAELARGKGILVIEDCAQAFCGRNFVGSPEAAVSMFSFGPIKTCTAFGGGVVTVRDPELLDRMEALQTSYPQQRNATFLRRTIKYAGFKVTSQSPYLYGAFVLVLRLLGKEHHRTITKLSHSLAAEADILPQIRLKPSPALVDFLTYRISRFDPKSLDARATRIAQLCDELPLSVRPIGHKQVLCGRNINHHYWICPIRVDCPRAVLHELLASGFDAAAGDASLVVVSDGRRGGDCDGQTTPPTATTIMKSVIYLPVDNIMDKPTTNRLVEAITRSATANHPAHGLPQ
jgi:perosamine synthetase